MKPSTYAETVLIVRAWSTGQLKKLLVKNHITYHCAMMRITRFRRKYPEIYREKTKC